MGRKKKIDTQISPEVKDGLATIASFAKENEELLKGASTK
jgi:hypothetical protein